MAVPKWSFRLIQLKVMKINLSKLLAQATIGAQQIHDINLKVKLSEDIAEIKEMLEELDFMIEEERVECGFNAKS